MKKYAHLALACGCYIGYLYISYKVGNIVGDYLGKYIVKRVLNA